MLVKRVCYTPQNYEDWVNIARGFETNWNFSNCIGAIDRKHVMMQAPPNTGSLYFNYKKFFSIVLMAVCDANYRFILVDIGDIGRNSDGGVFANSVMGAAFNEGKINLPEPRAPTNSSPTLPYTLVGDEAFPLKDFLMKPFRKEMIGLKERVYNYRLSRARRTIENTFGICSSRFRIFRRPINARVSVVIKITKAIVTLHNYLMSGKDFKSGNSRYCPPGYSDTDTRNGLRLGDWRNEAQGTNGLQSITAGGSNNYSRDAKTVRLMYRDHFCSSQGQVDWQWDYVTSA